MLIGIRRQLVTWLIGKDLPFVANVKITWKINERNVTVRSIKNLTMFGCQLVSGLTFSGLTEDAGDYPLEVRIENEWEIPALGENLDGR